MSISILDRMWNQVGSSTDGIPKLKVLRFSSDCLPSLFIGFDADRKRCLLLMHDAAAEVKPIKHENISLCCLAESSASYIMIRLENDYFSDLFDDFISSVLSQISTHKPDSETPQKFIGIFIRWCDFFEGMEPRSLSATALRGLIGELMYLGLLLSNAKPAEVNDILEAWVGPYHARADFTLADKHVEVKAISNSLNQVMISSEYQLEIEKGLGMELVVFYFELDSANGFCLSEQVDELRGLVYKLCGDFSIIIKGLREIGVRHDNIRRFDDDRFRHLKTSVYDVTLDGFPKLVRSNIASNIKSVKYTLKLHDLSEYLVSEQD
ncbi:PD-(D/E)XK motif protein [Akkermansiaceae bacterium]|nr:PD-(D/E)XK motif protein [Akkermansiaceae bacterium]